MKCKLRLQRKIILFKDFKFGMVGVVIAWPGYDKDYLGSTIKMLSSRKDYVLNRVEDKCVFQITKPNGESFYPTWWPNLDPFGGEHQEEYLIDLISQETK